MTGTELKIVLPAQTEVLGPEVDRLPTLHMQAPEQKSLSEAADLVGCAGVKIRQLEALCRIERHCELFGAWPD